MNKIVTVTFALAAVFSTGIALKKAIDNLSKEIKK